MGTSQGPLPNGGHRALTTAAGYLVLFVLGAFQGLIGCFQYSRAPAPLIAIVLVVIIFGTCVACGWGVGTFAGGLLPAVGWILVSFILATGRPNGSGLPSVSFAGASTGAGSAHAVPDNNAVLSAKAKDFCTKDVRMRCVIWASPGVCTI